MDEKKERRIAEAVIKQLKGLSYYQAQQILIWVDRLLKEASVVK